MAEKEKKIEKKWGKVRTSVINFIKENNGIASMLDAYNVARTVFPNYIWSSPKLEILSKNLVKNGIFQIDLTISHPKPLMIYPGHHSLMSTSFFVLSETSDDHESDVLKARKILDDLTEKAKENEAAKRIAKNKYKKRTNEQKEEDIAERQENKIYRKDQFISKEINRNGYIPMKKVQMCIFHLFISETFGTNRFTFQDLMNSFSFDLYSKLIGVRNTPEVFFKEPKLRHILVNCLPERIKEEIEYNNFKERLKKLLAKAAGEVRSTIACPYLKKKAKTYQMIRTDSIMFFDKVEVQFDFTNRSDVIEFHRIIQAICLIEYVDPHSVQLWLKQYSIIRSNRNLPIRMVFRTVEIATRPSFQFTFPYFYHQVENFIAKIGFDWAKIRNIIELKYPNFSFKSIKFSKNDPVRLFCYMKYQTFEPNPTLYISPLETGYFNFLKETNFHVTFNYLIALSSLLPSGLISNLAKPWNKITDITQKICTIPKDTYYIRMVPSNRHMFMLRRFKDYRDLYYFNIANLSSSILRFTMQDDSLEITTSQYFNLFNISQLRYKLDPLLGELIEMLKIILLSSPQFSMLKKEIKFLRKFDTSNLNEAVFFLKLSRFLTQKAIGNDGRPEFKCTKFLLHEFDIQTPRNCLSLILNFFKSTKDPEMVSRNDTNIGSIFYVLEDETPVSVNLLPPVVATINSKDIIRNPHKNSMTESSNKVRVSANYQFVSTSIGYPNLPDFTVAYDREDIEYVKSNYTTYEVDNCQSLQARFMQLFVLIYQTQPQDECSNFTFLCRLICSFVIQHFSKGVSLYQILHQYEPFGHDLVLKSLNFLEEYNFIYRIHSNTLLPHYVSDIYNSSHILKTENKRIFKPHFWIKSDGFIDVDIRNHLMTKIVEIINDEPGIELLEISSKLSNLTLYDLMLLLNALENDEIIYSMCYKCNENEFALFDDEVNCACEKADDNEYVLQLYKCLCNPDERDNVTKRNFYVASAHRVKLALVMSDNNYNIE